MSVVIGATLGTPPFKPEKNLFFSGLKFGVPIDGRPVSLSNWLRITYFIFRGILVGSMIVIVSWAIGRE